MKTPIVANLGFKVDDSWLAAIHLMGLPEQYEPMIMGLEASGTALTAHAVKANIFQTESRSSRQQHGQQDEQEEVSNLQEIARMRSFATAARSRDISQRSIRMPRSRR